jgi:hypothetical protein
VGNLTRLRSNPFFDVIRAKLIAATSAGGTPESEPAPSQLAAEAPEAP